MPSYPQVKLEGKNPKVKAAVAAYMAMTKDGRWAFKQTPDARFDAYTKAPRNIKEQVEVIMMRKESKKTRKTGGSRHQRKTRRSRK
jgi:hypothetical protein